MSKGPEETGTTTPLSSGNSGTISPNIDMAVAVDDLEEIIEAGRIDELEGLLQALHPADLSLLLEGLSQKHWPTVISRLDVARISDLMEELPDHLVDDLAEYVSHEELSAAIDEMASDDAADVLGDLPDELAEQLIAAMDVEDRLEVEALLVHDEDTAGGLMQTELVAVPEGATVNEAIEVIRAEAEDVGPVHFVYVVDPHDHLVGVLKLQKLLLAATDRRIAELIRRDVTVVTPEVDQEEVALMFRRYDLVALPVVDHRGKLLGRILHDDVADVFEEEADEDMMHIAGAAGEPELVYTDQMLKIASVRLPWLVATLGGLTIPALLVWAFQVSFPAMITLVPFIPVIGAMGGNVGSQSATIVVRGFATGRVDFQNLGRFLFKELIVSTIMGVACGALSGIVAAVWHGDMILSVIVTVSMLLAIVASALMGVLVPYFFRLVHIDPAIAAGPAVTTIDDIIAIGIYYLTAVALL